MLTIEKRDSIDSHVDLMLQYLEFIECVEQINRLYEDYEQIGYAVGYLINNFSQKERSHGRTTPCITSDKPNGVRN